MNGRATEQRGMYYYRGDAPDGGAVVAFSRQPLAPEQTAGFAPVEAEEISAADAASARLVYVSGRPGWGKTRWCVNHAGYLADAPEGLWCIDDYQLARLAAQTGPLPRWIETAADAGQIAGAALAPDETLANLVREQTWAARAGKKTVHILAMGDVGGTVLLGLALLGGDCVGALGVYDFDRARCLRWAAEINQTAYPWDYDRLPPVRVLEERELFDCDVFVFCASKGVPPVHETQRDVRLAQLEANSAIAAQYGRMARARGFGGLFAVVSDPVDQLCQAVWLASNRDADGHWDGKGLRPEQVQGYGLGVMNSRAASFAKADARFARFLTEGRAYGPHGQMLVIADSVAHYDDALSRELTQKTVEANLKMRELGYKPYVAPALSSAAISILLTVRGQWHYSSNFVGGIYLGCKNRSTARGVELEHLPLPDALLARIAAAERDLRRYGDLPDDV